MFFKNDFPILEFDDNKVAKLNPSALFEKKNPEKKMIITFFPEALEKLKEEKLIEKAYYIGGENPSSRIAPSTSKSCPTAIFLSSTPPPPQNITFSTPIA